VSYWQLNTY